jgi:hypothetical protein
VDRPAFINRLRFMSSFPHRLLVISARTEPSEVSICSFRH